MSPFRTTLRRPLRPLAAVSVSAIALIAPSTALADVSVSRAEIRSGTLRLAGIADPNRSITVNGTAMARSDGSGSFRVSRRSYRPPADCTVDVNDGSPTPATARLSGCTVRPAPAPAPAPQPAPGETATTLVSVTLSPARVTGGASSTATVTLDAPAPADGAVVTLATGNSNVARVPASVTVPAGAASAAFEVSTLALGASITASVSATYGVTRTASLTVNPVANPFDTVTISRAEFDPATGQLQVDAMTSRAGETLGVYVTATNAFIGMLSAGRGTFSVPSNPESITVRSSLGGYASRAVS
jgi:hypothetical protein